MTVSESHSEMQRSPDDDIILEIRNASVSFDIDGDSKVLKDVNLDIYREELLGVVGESGSGKSMLASAVLDAVVNPGVLTGEVRYFPPGGEPVDVLSLSDEELRKLRWEEIAMVFQGAMSSFNPTSSIRKHFVETLNAHDADVEEGLERTRQLLSDLYLDPERVLDSYPHELSGGMQQRTLIALSMVLEPNILVMDEPTAALDLLMQRSILKLLESVREKYNITIIFITHDLPLVAELADRLAVMYAFEIAEIGTTEEILQHAAHPYTRSLLNATPNLDAPLEEMKAIEGSSPAPVNVPRGCSYHPRCPLADETCREVHPSFSRVEQDHETACHHWKDAAREIPFNLDTQAEVVAESTAVRTTGNDETVVSLSDLEVFFESDSGILGKWFSDPDTVHAVDGVSLEIPENEVIALVGESGCGKTTLGKAAIGLQRPTGGSVEYRGQDIWDAKDKNGTVEVPFDEINRSLQIIHQDPGSSLNPNQKIMNTLAWPLRMWQSDLSKEDREARILGMLETVGMSPPEDYADRYPHQLSGGEKQRVALVRALLMNPDLILADEAISALDVSLRIEMMDLFLDLQERFNTSFLFISHDFSNARYLAEKADGLIGVMYLGKLVEIGPAKQILNDPQHPYTKVLKWATPHLRSESDGSETPMRKIDIPDPVNPPSGCRFHTRCPEAREVCKYQTPTHDEVDPEHLVSCFRTDDLHEYWNSEPLEDTDELSETQAPPAGD
ncbi:ABC transporter ATP-binding protein [Haladaptatus sp. CMAA 1911]|uniref:ABC transporter ATP-binding protein n=1 Tax=unclassified Haladaptatus TaxID=2622732 RepID=UPI0037547B0C